MIGNGDIFLHDGQGCWTGAGHPHAGSLHQVKCSEMFVSMTQHSEKAAHGEPMASAMSLSAGHSNMDRRDGPFAEISVPLFFRKTFQWRPLLSRGRILGRNWDKSLKSLPSCYSQSPLLKDFTPPPPLLEQKWFETGLRCKHYIRKP